VAARPRERSVPAVRTRSLDGRVVMVTRAKVQAAELAVELERRGATAILAPAIELVRAPGGGLDRAVGELVAGGFDWVLFTSRAGVEAVLDKLARRGRVAGAMDVKVAAVGDGTARALRDAGVEPALVPETFTTYALSRAMPRGSGRVLLPRADIATGELEAAVAAKGWTPVRVDAYRTRLSRRLPAPAMRALQEGRVDAITFTSASTVDGFVKMLSAASGRTRPLPKLVCIGPVTARTAKDHGMDVAGVARPHTIEGLLAALERVLRPVRTKEVR
jgi:uroporphyrinogen-III synthase